MKPDKRQLIKKVFVSAKLTALTGLRIGDSKENVEIGGVDNPVVRRKDNQQPYLPGSSLKGKIRSLLELATGRNWDSKSQNQGSEVIERLFGAGENTQKTASLDKEKIKKIKALEEEENELFNATTNETKDQIKETTKYKRKLIEEEYKAKRSKYESIQSRLIIRDAYLADDWATKLRESEYTDMPYTEIKWENVINRLKGTAEHPRQMERVPAGAEFNVNFVINIFDGDDEKEYLECLKSGLELLQGDYLGGSGSRGYGQVHIFIGQPEIKDIKDYLSDSLQSSIVDMKPENDENTLIAESFDEPVINE